MAALAAAHRQVLERVVASAPSGSLIYQALATTALQFRHRGQLATSHPILSPAWEPWRAGH